MLRDPINTCLWRLLRPKHGFQHLLTTLTSQKVKNNLINHYLRFGFWARVQVAGTPKIINFKLFLKLLEVKGAPSGRAPVRDQASDPSVKV